MSDPAGSDQAEQQTDETPAGLIVLGGAGAPDDGEAGTCVDGVCYL